MMIVTMDRSLILLIRGIIEQQIVRLSKNNKKVVYKYYIGPITNRINDVCRRIFLDAYRMKNSTLVSLTMKIREARWGSSRPLCDRTNASCGRTENDVNQSYENLENFAATQDLRIGHDQIALALVPNTPKAVSLMAWMERYFYEVGDMQPNRYNEIHIDHISITEVHRQYLLDMEGKVDPNDIASVGDLGKMWMRCFT